MLFRPFIFTFSSRRNYLYSSAFGRDRALMHLVNQVDGGQTDGESGRLTPRLERRKVSIKRDDLLRQAEQALNSLGNSKYGCFKFFWRIYLFMHWIHLFFIELCWKSDSKVKWGLVSVLL